MTDAELERLIVPVLLVALPRHGLEHADLISGTDHDGDPVLLVTLRFGAAASMPSGSEANDALANVRDALTAAGEDRFPHMDHRFPKDHETELRLRSQVRDLLRA